MNMETDSEKKPDEIPAEELHDDGFPDLKAGMGNDSSIDDAFKDFDTGPAKQSLGDLWATNPFLKIGVVLGGVLLLIAGYLLFGQNDDPAASTLAATGSKTEAPGGDVSETYRSAVEEVNQQRLENAIQTGESAIPIPLKGPTTTPNQEPQQPDDNNGDPLAQWRAAAQAPAPEPVQEQPVPLQPQPQPMQQPAAQVENPYQNAISQQMAGILDSHKIMGPKVMLVTSDNYLEAKQQAALQQQQVQAQQQLANQQETKEILISAGTINYATLLIEANSDIPGPVLARIQSGPLAGAKILGSFQNSDDYLVVTFNTVIRDGQSLPINAIAMDPNTTLTGVVTDKDNRYFRRVIMPAAAEFLSGMADAITDYGTQTVTVTGDTVITEKPKLNTKEQIYAGIGKGVEVIGDDLSNEASKVKPLVKVAAGTSVGILFLEPVMNEDSSGNSTVSTLPGGNFVPPVSNPQASGY